MVSTMSQAMESTLQIISRFLEEPHFSTNKTLISLASEFFGAYDAIFMSVGFARC